MWTCFLSCPLVTYDLSRCLQIHLILSFIKFYLFFVLIFKIPIFTVLQSSGTQGPEAFLGWLCTPAKSFYSTDEGEWAFLLDPEAPPSAVSIVSVCLVWTESSWLSSKFQFGSDLRRQSGCLFKKQISAWVSTPTWSHADHWCLLTLPGVPCRVDEGNWHSR